jgi:tight adherence protein C
MTPELMIATTFVVVVGFTFALALAIRRISTAPPEEELEPDDSRLGFPEAAGGIGPGVESLSRLFPQLPARRRALEMSFIRAGRFSRSAPIRYLAVRNLLVVVIVLVAATTAVLIGPEETPLALSVLGLGLMLIILCWAIPRLFLQWASSRRIERIRRSLPYVLDMISMCITGGASMRDALSHVGREIRESHPDTAVELAIVCEQSALASLDFGLSQFSTRMDLPEVAGIFGLVTHLDRLGVGAETALQGYSDSMRQKWRQQAEERANAKTVKLLFPLALCLMPSMMMLLWGPAAVDLFSFFRDGGISSVRDEVSGADPISAARERVQVTRQTRARQAAAAAPQP